MMNHRHPMKNAHKYCCSVFLCSKYKKKGIIKEEVENK